MGLFDSVYACCPHCNHRVWLQSHAGPNIMESYSIEAVPGPIAADLGENQYPWNTTCDNCKGRFKFVSDIPWIVRCKLTKWEENDG